VTGVHDRSDRILAREADVGVKKMEKSQPKRQKTSCSDAGRGRTRMVLGRSRLPVRSATASGTGNGEDPVSGRKGKKKNHGVILAAPGNEAYWALRPHGALAELGPCSVCGRKFYLHGQTTYCSDACRAKARRARANRGRTETRASVRAGKTWQRCGTLFVA